MNSAYRSTITGLSMLGQPRARQTLFHKTTFKVDNIPVSHVYLVVPHGQEQGNYWHISHGNLKRLEAGWTPEAIGCELADLPDTPPEYDDSAECRADVEIRARKEL